MHFRRPFFRLGGSPSDSSESPRPGPTTGTAGGSARSGDPPPKNAWLRVVVDNGDKLLRCHGSLDRGQIVRFCYAEGRGAAGPIWYVTEPDADADSGSIGYADPAAFELLGDHHPDAYPVSGDLICYTGDDGGGESYGCLESGEDYEFSRVCSSGDGSWWVWADVGSDGERTEDYVLRPHDNFTRMDGSCFVKP